MNETIKIVENDALTSLDGLDNIDYHSFDFLTLLDCPALFDCSVKPVCDHLQNGGSANISGNALGCSIIFEVMAACQVAVHETGSADDPILISPNPASGIVRIDIRAPGPWNIVLRDVMGHAVFGQKALDQEAQLDLSPLPAGVYFAELRSGERLWMRRIVME
ncbi:MAG: T9SS type A sorting domain-containing protein [Saprospiraceae bacterium]